ncbi:hypothetical protein C8Q74DRAFT_384586 [Fomes fomentarius]|nr:hypothetical protein C8Q74DRAFT_384586 [Fomes fomentarius]
MVGGQGWVEEEEMRRERCQHCLERVNSTTTPYLTSDDDILDAIAPRARRLRRPIRAALRDIAQAARGGIDTSVLKLIPGIVIARVCDLLNEPIDIRAGAERVLDDPSRCEDALVLVLRLGLGLVDIDVVFGLGGVPRGGVFSGVVVHARVRFRVLIGVGRVVDHIHITIAVIDAFSAADVGRGLRLLLFPPPRTQRAPLLIMPVAALTHVLLARHIRLIHELLWPPPLPDAQRPRALIDRPHPVRPGPEVARTIRIHDAFVEGVVHDLPRGERCRGADALVLAQLEEEWVGRDVRRGLLELRDELGRVYREKVVVDRRVLDVDSIWWICGWR